MSTFKISPKFFIFFTLIASIPASAASQLLQNLLQQFSNVGVIKQLISLGLIVPPTTVAIIIFMFWLYDAYLWKIWPFCFIHSVPNVNGRYEGEGESSFNGGHKYKMVLEIKQSLSDVKVCSHFEKSSSFSTVANLVKNEYGNWELSYIYKSKPKTINTYQDMRTHEGFASFEIFDNGKRLEGKYFNDLRDRKTCGTFSCKLISKEWLGCFDPTK